MAGLLAWAADVVAGNESSGHEEEDEDREEEDEEEEEEVDRDYNDLDGDVMISRRRRQQQRPQEEAQWRWRLRLSAEEEEEVQLLDARAASLQQHIRQLRQRQRQQGEFMAPPLNNFDSNSNSKTSSLSSFPSQASADSIASALAAERNAHQHALKEAESREASLLEENSAYNKAVISVEKLIQEKVRERGKLESCSQELEKELLLLNETVARIENSTQVDHPSQWSFEDNKADVQMSSSDKALMEGEELQRTRTELKMWEEKLGRLEQEWMMLVQNATKLPSSIQREKDLERRLRSLAEQLVSKQAQADSLTKERLLLDRQLYQASERRRQLQLSNAGSDVWKTKTTGSVGLSSSNSSSVQDEKTLLEWIRNPQVTLMPLQMILRQMSDAFQNAWFHGNWSKQICLLLTNTTFRALVVAYIVSLHIIAYAFVSFAS